MFARGTCTDACTNDADPARHGGAVPSEQHAVRLRLLHLTTSNEGATIGEQLHRQFQGIFATAQARTSECARLAAQQAWRRAFNQGCMHLETAPRTSAGQSTAMPCWSHAMYISGHSLAN